MRFSASMLRTYMDCQLQARFKYFDNLPDVQNAAASFGSCVHHALEFYNKTGDLDAALETFEKVWYDPALLGVEPQTWPKYTSFGSYKQQGLEILREYDAKQKWETRTIIATEHKFLVPFGKHELSGIVDLIELKKGAKGKDTLRIVDYKTSSKQPSKIMLNVNVQFTIYEYASHHPQFWLGHGEKYPPVPQADEAFLAALENTPRRCVWYHLKGNKELDAGQRGDQDYLRLYRACSEIERSIEAGVFVPDISGETCTYCPYVEPCGLPIPSREDDDD
jgi:RecB family exonuclease